MNRLPTTAAAAILALALGLTACSANSPAGGAPGPLSVSAPVSASASVPRADSAQSATDLPVPAAPTDSRAAAAWEALMSPDGEYAASAAYQAVIALFGPVEPYVSIRAAEERHIDALTRQLQRMDVIVPPNPYAGKVPAPSDLHAAAAAWATGEVDNVAMYDRLLATVNGDATLTRVLSNLRRASQDVHLPAFRLAAENGGTLTQDQMTALGMA